MKVFFLSKKGGMLIGIYIMAFCLLAAGTGIIMPDSVFVTGSADTVPQPWRCGSEDSHSISPSNDSIHFSLCFPVAPPVSSIIIT